MDERVVSAGTHGKAWYFIDTLHGDRVKHVALNENMYASPVSFNVEGCSGQGFLGVTIDGTFWIRWHETGEVYSCKPLAEEPNGIYPVFSSPVLSNNGKVVVGCRNDYVYILSLKVLLKDMARP